MPQEATASKAPLILAGQRVVWRGSLANKSTGGAVLFFRCAVDQKRLALLQKVGTFSAPGAKDIFSIGDGKFARVVPSTCSCWSEFSECLKRATFIVDAKPLSRK